MRAAALALALAAGCGGATEPRATPSPTPSPTVSAEVADIAYITKTGVHLRGRSGAVRDLDTGAPYYLVWSVDGRYVAWVRDETLRVHDVATARTGSWRMPFAGKVGATAGGFVLVNYNGPHQMAVLDPATVVTGTPASPVAVTGIPDTARVDLLVATAVRILITSDEVASGQGGPDTVYDVTATGHATRLFTDGEDQPDTAITNLPMYPAVLTGGRSLIYETGATAGRASGCDGTAQYLATWDLVGKREVANAPQPLLPKAKYQNVSALAVGEDGRAYAVVDAGCPKTERTALFRRDATRWTQIATAVTWGAASVDSRLAVIRTNGDLAVDGRVVAHQVVEAAWAPRAG